MSHKHNGGKTGTKLKKRTCHNRDCKSQCFLRFHLVIRTLWHFIVVGTFHPQIYFLSFLPIKFLLFISQIFQIFQYFRAPNNFFAQVESARKIVATWFFLLPTWLARQSILNSDKYWNSGHRRLRTITSTGASRFQHFLKQSPRRSRFYK